MEKKILLVDHLKVVSGHGYEAKAWSLHVWKPRVVGVLGTKKMQ
jgi:hypothetical protein